MKNLSNRKKIFENDLHTEDKNYILHPMRFQLKSTINPSTTNFKNTPEMELDLIFKSSIVITICKEQLETVLRFVESISDIMKMKSNLHLRPLVRSLKEGHPSIQAWWKYIIMAVIEQNRSKVNLVSMFQKYFMVKKYINLYKRLKKFVR